MQIFPIERFLFPKLEFQRYLSDRHYAETVRRLVDQGVGGFVCFAGSLEQARRVIDELRVEAAHRLLFAADCEYGTAMRFDGGEGFPPMMGLAESDDPALVEEVAWRIAGEMRAAGLDWNLAPVLDINTNRRNPIINVRSFGETPKVVSRFAAAYIRGLHAGGILGCGKHLPGHGDTALDSHIGLPRLDHPHERLRRLELVPFAAAAGAGVDALMTAHLAVPSLGTASLPVSLSGEAIALLRETLAWDGVLITDALDMGAVARRGAEVVVEAFNAGNDILEMPEDPIASLQALRQAEQEGRVPDARRIDASRRLAGLYDRVDRRQQGEPDAVAERSVTEVAGRDLAERAARGAVRIVGEPIPPPERTGRWHLFVGPMDDAVARRIRARLATESVVQIDAGEEGEVLRYGDPSCPAVILLAYSPRGGAGRITLEEVTVDRLMSDPAGLPWIVTLGNPYLPSGLRARGQVDLFGQGPESIALCAEFVTGRVSERTDGLS